MGRRAENASRRASLGSGDRIEQTGPGLLLKYVQQKSEVIESMLTVSNTEPFLKSRVHSAFAGGLARWFRLAMLFLTGLLLMQTIVGTAFSQSPVDDARQVLGKKSYPWYDADSDSVRPIELGERPSARSANRNEIPLKEPTDSASTKTGNGWGSNWNWGRWDFGAALLGGLNAVTWAAIIVLAIALVGVLIWAIMRMNSNAATDDENVAPIRSMEESIKQLPFDFESSTGDFRKLAQAAYTSGDYRKAITYLFSHVLVSLDQKGLIRLRKGKTNREYLRELRRHRPLANYYQHVMVPFESAFFGDHDLEKSEFEACWNQLDHFQTGVQQTRQVANV